MKKLIKNKHFIVTIIVLLITLVSFSSVIIKNNSVFILYGDSVEQYYQFLLGFWQKVHDGNFAMFDYTNGYGANVYSMVYYNMFSPFTWLILLLKKEWIMYAVLYLQILKMIVLANFSVLWLSKLSKNNNHILIGSLILTFSGWLFFYWHYDFLNSIVFYPLILYFIEIYLQNNKTLGLIISTCILTICNYYFMYMFVPFACLYALFRYITLNKDNTFKKVLYEGIRFALIFVLSIFAGSFVLVPCIKIILESGRISDGELNLFITFEDFFRIFTSLFTPVFSRIEPNRFILISKTTYQGWGGGASIYTSLLMLMFIPTTFFIDDKKKRNCLLIFGLLICIFMISPYFYKLFQGSIDTRFFYMTIFFNVMLFVELMDNYKKEYFKYLLINFLVLGLLFGICFIYSYKNELSITSYLKELLIIGIILFVISFISIFLIKYKQTKLLLIPIILECLLSNINFVRSNTSIEYESVKDDWTYDGDVYKSIKNNDDSFYRVLGASIQNESFANDINGVSFYTSIYNYQQRNYLDLVNTNWSVPYYIEFNSLYTLAGAKYWYPSTNNKKAPDGYSKVDGQDYYINKYYVELGWVNNNTINVDYFNTLEGYEKTRVLKEYVATETSGNKDYKLSRDLEVLYDANLESTSDVGGYIELNFDEPISDCMLYVVKSSYPILEVFYYSGDEIINELNYYMYGTNRLPISEDEKVDRIVININGEQAYTLEQVTIYKEDNISKLEEELYKLRKENSFINVEYKSDYIKGDISVDEDNSLVYTYVPYDSGFKVKANGQEIEYFKVNGGFIGFNLDKGDYTIEFTYCIPRLKEGICISIVSIVLLVVIVKKTKKG